MWERKKERKGTVILHQGENKVSQWDTVKTQYNISETLIESQEFTEDIEVLRYYSLSDDWQAQSLCSKVDNSVYIFVLCKTRFIWSCLDS